MLMTVALGAAAVPAAWADAPSQPQPLEPAAPPSAGASAMPGAAPSVAPPHARGPMAGPHAGPRIHHGQRGSGNHRPHGHMPGGRGAGPGMMLLGPGLDRALDVASATPEQRAEIRRIAGAARDDLRAARRQDPRPAREAWMAAWSAEQLDASAMDRQRQQEVARREAQSRRMMQAVVDIGKVLKPEQRRALAEHWRVQRGAHHGAHHRAEFPLIGHHAELAAD